MMNRLVEDLRFVIGLLFGSIGLILLAVACGDAQVKDALNLNLTTGIVMLVFALAMIGMSLSAAKGPHHGP